MEIIQELLVDQLRDILHAEKQVQKALPKMVKAAHSQQLQQLLETHLEETETQIERLEECFGILGIQPREKACKGMMGIVEEGEEVMAEGKKKDETAADLALIGAAQKVLYHCAKPRPAAPPGADRAVVAALPGRRGERRSASQSARPAIDERGQDAGERRVNSPSSERTRAGLG
jgi:Mn-containing catalase